MSERLTIASPAVAGLPFYLKKFIVLSQYRNLRSDPWKQLFMRAEKSMRHIEIHDCTLATIPVRQVLWGGVASHSRRIMMHAACASSPSYVDPRRMLLSNE